MKMPITGWQLRHNRSQITAKLEPMNSSGQYSLTNVWSVRLVVSVYTSDP